MANHRGKLSFAIALGVSEICRTSKHPTFDTFTFAENVTEKAEAMRRWRRLKARLKRRYSGLRGVGVWQRQGRGAWHLHYVFDRRLDVVQVREWALACGFGSQLNMRSVGDIPGYRQGWSPERVARYLCRYVTRDIDATDKSVRVSDYCGDSRKATVAFRWAGGIGQLYRLGRAWWSEIYGGDPFDRPCAEQRSEAFWLLVRMGWQGLTEPERQKLLAESDAVASWFDPERYPF